MKPAGLGLKRAVSLSVSVATVLLSLNLGAQISPVPSSVMSSSPALLEGITNVAATTAAPAAPAPGQASSNAPAASMTTPSSPPTNPTLPTITVSPTSPTTTVITESVGGLGAPGQVGTLTTTINFAPPSTVPGFSGVLTSSPVGPAQGTGLGSAVTSGPTTSLGSTAGVGPGASPYVTVPGLPPGVAP